MNKQFLFMLTLLSGFFISCEKDDHDHDDECHACHIAIEECCGATGVHDPGEHEIDILDGEEFCGDDLEEIETNGWVAIEAIMHDGNEIYSVGDTVPANIIHCEEHADGHDH